MKYDGGSDFYFMYEKNNHLDPNGSSEMILLDICVILVPHFPLLANLV